MEELLKQILHKLEKIESRIITIEEELSSYEGVSESPFEDIDNDVEDIIPKAVSLLPNIEKVTYSYLQHKLECGYGKTVRVADRLTELGLISPDESGIFYNVHSPEVRNFLKKMNEGNKWN